MHWYLCYKHNMWKNDMNWTRIISYILHVIITRIKICEKTTGIFKEYFCVFHSCCTQEEFSRLFAVYFVKQIFCSNIFYWNKLSLQYDSHVIFFLLHLVSNNITYYGRGNFKPFTNYHVSWDTLYLKIYHSFKSETSRSEILKVRLLFMQ